MLRTIPGFDRIGEENAFAVLARAGALARTLKPITGAPEASASVMSDSVMAPTPE